MSVDFYIRPHETFGNITNIDLVNIERGVSRVISIDRTDTKETLVQKLIDAGRIKQSALRNNYVLQRDGDVIALYDLGVSRADSVIIAELIRVGVQQPLDGRTTPNRDGDDFDFNDLGALR